MSFQKGDKVILKSGGPEMTIVRVIGETDGNKMDEVMKMRGFDDDDALCEFINQKSKPERAAFKAVMLRSADEPSPVEEEEPEEELEDELDELNMSDESEEEEDDLNLDDFDF
ncbi:MAG: hypothetical protein AAF598_09725 [Bacteroidota bacterium]